MNVLIKIFCFILFLLSLLNGLQAQSTNINLQKGPQNTQLSSDELTYYKTFLRIQPNLTMQALPGIGVGAGSYEIIWE